MSTALDCMQLITQLFSEGNLKQAQSKLLHSSSWQQGQALAYGHSQQRDRWTQWLGHCGLSTIQHSSIICTTNNQTDGAHKSVLRCDMLPTKGKHSIRALFFISHNDSHIKSVDMAVDTALLESSLALSNSFVRDWWPQPDPLVICDYDHQIHQDSLHAMPTDLIASTILPLPVLDAWWEIWQQMQLNQINSVYSDTAEILLPGQLNAQNKDSMFEYISQLMLNLDRPYSQLTDVCVDTKDSQQIAISWYIEGNWKECNGDEGRGLNVSSSVLVPVKVRLCFSSFIVLKEGKIQTETVIFDQTAFDKQFSLS